MHASTALLTVFRATLACVIGVSLLALAPGCRRTPPSSRRGVTIAKQAHVQPAAAVPRPSPPQAAQASIRLVSDVSVAALTPLIDLFAATHHIDIHVLPVTALTSRRPYTAALLRDVGPLTGVRLRPWAPELVDLTLPCARPSTGRWLTVGLGLRVFMTSPEARAADVAAGGLARHLDVAADQFGWCPSCSDTEALVGDMVRAWGPVKSAARLRRLRHDGRAFSTSSALFSAIRAGEIEVGLGTFGMLARQPAAVDGLKTALSAVPRGPVATGWPMALAAPAVAENNALLTTFARFLLQDERARALLPQIGVISAAADVDPPESLGAVLDRLYVAPRTSTLRAAGRRLLHVGHQPSQMRR